MTGSTSTGESACFAVELECARGSPTIPGLLPRSLRIPLTALQVATVATLMRSIALDRWITVAASLLLLTGAYAASRERTWGVALSYMLGVTFVGIALLGVAPAWFGILGFLAIRPFARMFRHLLRFDRGAALLLASGASLLGIAGAMGWKGFALDLFAAFPALVPSLHLHHLPLVATVGAVASFLALRRVRAEEREAVPFTRVRIAPEAPAVAELEDEEAAAELEEAAPRRVAERSLR